MFGKRMKITIQELEAHLACLSERVEEDHQKIV